jgi:hypothetical protein
VGIKPCYGFGSLLENSNSTHPKSFLSSCASARSCSTSLTSHRSTSYRAIGPHRQKSATHRKMCFIKLAGAKTVCSPGSAAGSGNRVAFPGVFWAVDCVSGALRGVQNSKTTDRNRSISIFLEFYVLSRFWFLEEFLSDGSTKFCRFCG